MASSGLVKARWVAGYPALLPNGREVHNGDTAQIPEGEAGESANWEPVKAKNDEKDDA